MLSRTLSRAVFGPARAAPLLVRASRLAPITGMFTPCVASTPRFRFSSAKNDDAAQPSGMQHAPVYNSSSHNLTARELELEELKQRLRALGPSPLAKQLGRDADVPADYRDPRSVSGNPALATVPVRAIDDSDAAATAESTATAAAATGAEPKRRLVRDEEETAVFHHSPAPIAVGSAHTVAPSDTTAVSDGPGGVAIGQVSPRIVIGMTCGVCNTRLVKTMSKLSYTKGVVLIRCDGCSNTHLVADNLGWFDDHSVNIEDIMREQGQEVTRASADDGIDALTPEVVDRIARLAKEARESDLAAPLTGVAGLKANESKDAK